MSWENVELVRRIHEAWDRGDSVREFLAEDMEYVNPSYAVEPGTRVGRSPFGLVRETYPDFQFHIDRVIDTGGEDVVVLGRYSTSGDARGIRLEGDPATYGRSATASRCASSGTRTTARR